MYCPSCGSEYRDEVSECVDCQVPPVREPPMSSRRRRITIFPPRISTRPFLLELLGVVLTLAGGLAVLNALVVVFKTLVSDSEPGFGLRISEILIDSVSGFVALSVAYAIWKERAWSRPALVAFGLLATGIQGWLEWEDIVSLAGSLLAVAFLSWYLYLWPSAADYYRRLQEAGKPPSPGLPADA